MAKKIVLALLIATLVTGGAFAQLQMSAGIGGNFGVHMTSLSHDDFDIDNPKPIIGGGFNAFFDATYAMLKVGMFFGGNSEEESYMGETMKNKSSFNYFSLGLLGKIPIELGSITLFPMLGFEWNILTGGKFTAEFAGESESESFSRSDFEDDKSYFDMFIIQLGVGADFNLTDRLYLRPTILWGIDVLRNKAEKDFKDNNGSTFKHKLDIGIALGFKF